MYDESSRPPIFTVVTPAATAALRRLTTAVKVQAALGIATDTTLIETYIDFVSAACAAYCALARDQVGTPPTFASEALRATFLVSAVERGTRLVLPWRPHISAVAVVEDLITLTQDTDYRLLGGGMLERVTDDTPICWPSCKIVVNYTAGLVLATSVPAEIEGLVIDQVKMQYQNRAQNPSIRQESVPEVYSATYSAMGGLASTSIGTSGLLLSLEDALGPYKGWTAS